MRLTIVLKTNDVATTRGEVQGEKRRTSKDPALFPSGVSEGIRTPGLQGHNLAL